MCVLFLVQCPVYSGNGIEPNDCGISGELVNNTFNKLFIRVVATIRDVWSKSSYSRRLLYAFL